MKSVLLGRQVQSLHFAVRPLVVAKHVGYLFLPLAALTCVPLAVAVLTRSFDAAWRYALVASVLGGLGWLCTRIRCTPRIQTNEALTITALIFLISGLLMSIPLQAYGLTPLDAVFEAVSGVTTTGLSTLSSTENRASGLLFGRAWLQWVGGLGVVVLALALVIRPGVASKRLGFEEREIDDLVGGTRAHARRVLLIYSVITLIGILVLWAAGVGFFDAVVHSMAAVSTGGFATHDDSLSSLPFAPQAVIMLLCLSGAVSFSLYYSGIYRKPLHLLRDRQLQALLIACLVTALVVWICLFLEEADADPWKAVSMGISSQTTAGFSSMQVPDLPDAAKLTLILSMLIGGEVGSTAGGLKILRMLILGRILLSLMQEVSIPRSSRFALKIGDGSVGWSEIRSTVAVVGAYLIAIVLSWFAFLLYGHDAIDSLFEVASATATAGLSAGLSGPELQAPLKGVLSLDMLLGRVEIIALLVLIFPPTWIGKRRNHQ